MAACPSVDGDSADRENFESTSNLKVSRLHKNQNIAKSPCLSNKSNVGSLDGEKAYDTVANLEESELRNLLEEVISQKQSKNDKSAIAQFLIRKEEDALKEESGSGEDTFDLAFGKHKRKKGKDALGKRDTYDGSPSAASRNSTGGSLGSLQNLSDPKVPEKTNTKVHGVAARSRAGGSCGNLSKSSFETHASRRRNRRSRDTNRASISQREGGSLQNISKAVVTGQDSKRLHKSESLSQVYNDVVGVRLKHRRQKTSSESSGRNHLYRRPDESSDDDAQEVPYQRLPLSSHSSVCDPVEGGAGPAMANGHWVDERVLDVLSGGETTEEDAEMGHCAARAKLGMSDAFSRHLPSGSHDTELHSVVTHLAHRDLLPTISSDSEVDKPINFSLDSKEPQKNLSLSSGPTVTYVTPAISTVFDVEAASYRDDKVCERRRGYRSLSSNEDGTSEKSQMDENGNPILMSVRSTDPCSSVSNTMASVSTVHPSSGGFGIARRNGFNASSKDISTYSRLKAKQDKKKAIREKDVMPSEKTPGFRGDESLDAILKFLGAEESSNSKAKKKSKGKKDEVNDKISSSLKKNKTKSLESSHSLDDVEQDLDGVKMNGLPPNPFSKDTESKDSKKNKKLREQKKNKRNSGMLRESSSVEDLVSKSKLSSTEKEVKKQVTLDDGVALSALPPSHSMKKGKRNESKNETRSKESKAEFKSDFYKVGDPIVENELSCQENLGEFELVSRKKGKKSKNSPTVAQDSRRGGSGGWNPPNNYDAHRRSTFPRASSRSTSSHETEISFKEGPFTVHDAAFMTQLSGKHNPSGERYSTTSVPQSEESDSDGDSVHSMPANSISRQNRENLTSSDSTPQASYANIARLASSSLSIPKSNKKASTVTTSPPPASTSLGDSGFMDRSTSDDSNSEPNSSILDNNFPPLSGSPSTQCDSTNSGEVEAVHKVSPDSKIPPTNIKNKSVSSEKQKAVPVNLNENDVVHAIPSDLTPKSSSGVLSVASVDVKNSSVSLVKSNSISSNVKSSSVSSIVKSNFAPSNVKSSSVPSIVKSNSAPSNVKSSSVSSIVKSSSAPSNVKSTSVPSNVKSTSVSSIVKSCVSPIVKTSSVSPIFKSSSLSCSPISTSGKVSEKTDSGASINMHMNEASKESGRKKDTKKSKPKPNPCESVNIINKSLKNEPPVVFTDNPKFDLSHSGIEFGFDLSIDNLVNLMEEQTICESSKNNICKLDTSVTNINNNNNNQNNNNNSNNIKTIKNKRNSEEKNGEPASYNKNISVKSNKETKSVTDIIETKIIVNSELKSNSLITNFNNSDISKKSKTISVRDAETSSVTSSQKEPVASYNYEDVRKFLFKGQACQVTSSELQHDCEFAQQLKWEATLRMMEENPQNVQFWKSASKNK